MTIRNKLTRKWPHTYESYDMLPVYYRHRPLIERYWAANTEPIGQRIKDTEAKMVALMKKHSGRTIHCIGVKYHTEGEKKGKIVRMKDI